MTERQQLRARQRQISQTRHKLEERIRRLEGKRHQLLSEQSDVERKIDHLHDRRAEVLVRECHRRLRQDGFVPRGDGYWEKSTTSASA